MNLTSLLGLFGGLALFLYGMHMMSNGLENAAGDRMKTILEKLTSNRFQDFGRSFNYCCYPKFFRNNCYGRWIC